MSAPVRKLPLSFADAREVVAELLGTGFRVMSSGWQDDTAYLVVYEEADGPSWDLDTMIVDKATGFVIRLGWEEGQRRSDGMRPIR